MSEHVLNKVRDLLKLSDGAGIHESAAAAKAAQRLLTKNRLTMADVYASSEKAREPIVTSEDPLYVGTRIITWRGYLAGGVAEANCCSPYWSKSWLNGRWKQRLLIIGRQSDIDQVRYLYNSISAQIEALCAAALLGYHFGGGKTFANNFKLGAVTSVIERLNEAQNEVEQEYVGTSALVLVKKDKAELDEAVTALKLTSRKSSARYSREGQKAGERAGKSINLNRSMGGRKAKGMLS
jgi:hypothetical protein